MTETNAEQHPQTPAEVYRVAYATSNSSAFFWFWAEAFVCVGPQYRFQGCHVFDGARARPIPDRILTKGDGVLFCYTEPRPSWLRSGE